MYIHIIIIDCIDRWHLDLLGSLNTHHTFRKYYNYTHKSYTSVYLQTIKYFYLLILLLILTLFLFICMFIYTYICEHICIYVECKM